MNNNKKKNWIIFSFFGQKIQIQIQFNEIKIENEKIQLQKSSLNDVFLLVGKHFLNFMRSKLFKKISNGKRIGKRIGKKENFSCSIWLWKGREKVVLEK